MEASKLTPNLTVKGANVDLINGGALRGNNLFHSFTEFNIKDGQSVYFANPLGVINILTIRVNAKSFISLVGNSYIQSTVEVPAVGKGGNIDINAASLSILDGAHLQTDAWGDFSFSPQAFRDAGNLNIKVTGAVEIVGTGDFYSSGIYNDVRSNTDGSSGNITIDAGSLKLDGATIDNAISGVGKTGDVTINTVGGVSLINNSSIASFVESGGVGNGGNININAATLSLSNGSELRTDTSDAFFSFSPAGQGLSAVTRILRFS